MKIVSVILARGGSKGIPNKNIIDIKGKPLIEYSIQASLASQISETWVSTDCLQIKDVSQRCGAKVLDRPTELATDISSSEDALLHFSDNIDFDILVFLQPTSPLLLAKDINMGINLLLEGEHDSVFSVYREHWIPRWSLNMQPKHWDINKRPMRQEVEELLVENGAFYISTRKQLLNSRLRYGNKIGYIEMPLYRSFQIDTIEDLELIKKLL